MDVGALVEPLTVAWHAVKISSIEKGQSALILGGGNYYCTYDE
jgi:(R,R)-butanediol dehydrogenase/meso-butanediol dehydrogenase/diacetyl reductase